MSEKKTQEEFVIKYDGPALTNHSMNAADLGPALLAISNLCQEANKVLTGKDARVEVQVKAVGEGSFKIAFELIQHVKSVMTPLLPEENPTAKEILELLGLVGGTGLGLFALLKWKKGKRILEEKEIENDQIQISVQGDNNVIIVDSKVNKLLHSPNVRAAQRDLLSPLYLEGITKFSVQSKEFSIEATESEVDDGYYDVVPEEVGLAETPVQPQEIEALLVLRAPVFEKDKKWQFVYGSQIIYVSILDKNFNNKVFKKGERFGVGDRFKVNLRIIQNVVDGRVRNTYEIIEVLETMEGLKQQGLL